MKQKKILNILVIPAVIPFPPDDGGKLCIFCLVDYLRKFHKIQILLSAASEHEKNIIQNLSVQWPDVVIHTDDMVSKIEVSAKTKVISFIKRLLVKDKPVANVSSAYSVNRTTPFSPHSSSFIKKLTQITNENKFDIIQTELTRMLNLVNVFPPDVKKVFVQIEGRGDVLYDYGISNNLDIGYVKHVAGNTSFLEFAYMKEYDAILTLNDADTISISQKVPANVKVYTSPYGILDADIKGIDNETFEAENLIFMGSESHYPNVDALDWFLKDIIPEFKTIPFKKLYVTGKWSPETIEKYQSLNDRVNFIGFVDDLSPYLKNSVSIVPIRIGGGGIRTKILSSMVHGSPVVATSLSSVGIKGAHQKELLIADNVVDFANAISVYFNDKAFSRNVAGDAYKLIINEYSQSKVGAIRNGIYDEICQ